MRRPPPLVMIGLELDAVTLPATRPRAWWERLLGLRAPNDADLLRREKLGRVFVSHQELAVGMSQYVMSELESGRDGLRHHHHG